jgi:hypothetical protein
MGSRQFIQKEIWGLNDEQISVINDQRKQEKITDAEVESAKPEEAADETGGGPFGSEEEGGEEEGGEPAGEEGGEESAGGEEDLFAGDEPADDAEPGSKLLLSIDEPDFSSTNLYEKDKLPVKKNARYKKAPYSAKKAQYDSSRRKKHQLHEPNFSDMISNQQTLDDPYDTKWLRNQFRDPLGMNESLQKKNYSTTSLPPDVMSSLKKMSDSLGIHNKRNEILSENASLMNQEELDIEIEEQS